MSEKQGDKDVGLFYVIGTPIGNLEDLSFRAVRILGEVDGIYAEDTRHSQALLNHLKIRKPLLSCHEHNEGQRIAEISERLRGGENLALVSDAGLPGISDPGGKIMAHLGEEGLPFTVIPGPNAALAALLLSGLPAERFAFEGFLPRDGKARKERIAELRTERRTLIFYESPLRVIATLEELQDAWGDRRAALCREITKLYETCLRGSIDEILAMLNGAAPKGECVLVLAGAELAEELDEDPAERLAKMARLIEEGMRAKDAARRLSDEVFSANALYKLYLQTEQ